MNPRNTHVVARDGDDAAGAGAVDDRAGSADDGQRAADHDRARRAMPRWDDQRAAARRGVDAGLERGQEARPPAPRADMPDTMATTSMAASAAARRASGRRRPVSIARPMRAPSAEEKGGAKQADDSPRRPSRCDTKLPICVSPMTSGVNGFSRMGAVGLSAVAERVQPPLKVGENRRAASAAVVATASAAQPRVQPARPGRDRRAARCRSGTSPSRTPAPRSAACRCSDSGSSVRCRSPVHARCRTHADAARCGYCGAAHRHAATAAAACSRRPGAAAASAVPMRIARGDVTDPRLLRQDLVESIGRRGR